MSSLKPIVLYSHASGPNPWKVAIVLEELNLPYETKFLEFPQMKQEPFESLNPNGRVPAIEDPNTGVKLFESGAIIEYLIETYDQSATLHYASSPEKFLEKSWLHFQMSGQGPYYGQKAWFAYFHPERNITSAIERYTTEIKRVLGVIDRHLAKSGKPYLVGDKVSYADLAFVPWHMNLGFLLPDSDPSKEFPTFAKWNQSLLERPSVKKIAADKAAASQKH
ncbi:Glutathione S-transferase [Macrophomina phaseolina MS6]|uniref:Glutathione S-transferase n=1 Tax=Macrophomina phaseolina (strain MS6) TaxID=1126212 RepID=K2RII6_MACPH|nr:Glutathione S-transferase [Macrophomina phaseolina MS6]